MNQWILVLFILLPEGNYHVTILETFRSELTCLAMLKYVAKEMHKEYPDDTTSYMKCLPVTRGKV